MAHPPPVSPPAHPYAALIATLAVQILLALSMSSAAVLAPAVAPTLGYAPERVGVFAGIGYLTAMLSGLRSGHWVAAIGAMRLSQVALLASASGVAWVAFGPPQALLAGAALIGAGYGIVNPAAAAVLTQHSPDRARGIFFSIKQTGVPLGVALAGLSLPLGLATLGWRPTVAAVGGACLFTALALQPLVARLEPPQHGRPPDGSLALLRRVWRSPVLRPMSLASFSYAATQQGFVTFLVAMLHLELGWSLAAAAGVLAASQGVSAVARIAFGAVGDRLLPPLTVLVGLGMAMSAACLAMAALGPGTPALVVTLVAMACAATAMGWNGVFFAALSHRVDRADMARVSGATQFFTFCGGMAGPLLFGEVVRAGAGWSWGFVVVGLVPAVAGWNLARAQRAPSGGA
jgi:MFS family permease